MSRYQSLLTELRDRGWGEFELAAVSHENVLRVLEASDDDYEAFLSGTAPEPRAAALVPAVDTRLRAQNA